MVPVREHLRLVRQVGPAAVHQIDARQTVLLGDLLRAQVFLHRHRKIGAALHGRVIGDNHHLTAGHPANASDHPRAGRVVIVQSEGGQLTDFQERSAGIQKALHPIARQKLAARSMPRPRRLRPAQRRRGDAVVKLFRQCTVGFRIAKEGFTVGIYDAF